MPAMTDPTDGAATPGRDGNDVGSRHQLGGCPDGGSVRVLHLAGEYDIATADELQAALDPDQLGAHGLLVVDLTQVTFIDACCTGLLLGAASKRPIRVVGASWIVERVLDLVDPDHQQLPRGHTLGGQTDMNPD
jgi:anti-anti-sigma factor